MGRHRLRRHAAESTNRGSGELIAQPAPWRPLAVSSRTSTHAIQVRRHPAFLGRARAAAGDDGTDFNSGRKQ